ncbi:hypothetical protein NPIL_655951, partial [Nephila pilipes]
DEYKDNILEEQNRPHRTCPLKDKKSGLFIYMLYFRASIKLDFLNFSQFHGLARRRFKHHRERSKRHECK